MPIRSPSCLDAAPTNSYSRSLAAGGFSPITITR